MRHGQHRVAQGQAEGLSRASSLGQLGKEQQHLSATKGCFQAGKQNLSVPATLLLSIRLLSEVWQTDSPFDVLLVSAQYNTKGFSVLLEGREQTFAQESRDEADKPALLSCVFRLNILEAVCLGLSLCLGLIQLKFVVTAGSREAAIAIREQAKEVKACRDKRVALAFT